MQFYRKSILIILTAVQICFSQSDEIIFYSNGNSFYPLISVEGSPTILWTFADGSTSSLTNPTKDYGSPQLRANRLKVSPWSAIRMINIGYDGQDGGSSSIPFVSNQHVSNIDNLSLAAPYLVTWCSSFNDLSSLNFDNFVNLETIESYQAPLTSISLSNTPKLKRLCLENNNLLSLNLSGCTALEDLRGALNEYNNITFSGSTDELWHICIRTNYSITNPFMFSDMSMFPSIVELFIWDTNQSGAFTMHSSTNSTIWLRCYNNNFTSLDLSGSLQNENYSAYVDFENNQIETVNISGCDQIKYFNLENNNLSSNQVDYILQTIDAFGTSNGILILAYNNIASAAGKAAKENLQTRGWTVLVSPLAIFNDGVEFEQNIIHNSVNQAIGRFLLKTDTGNLNLTGVSIQLNGSRTGLSNLKLWASTDISFNPASDLQIGSTIVQDPGNGNSVSFSGFSKSITTSGTYFFLTGDVSATASGFVQGKIIQNSSLIFNSTGSFYQNISDEILSGNTSPLPVELSTFKATFDGDKVHLNWKTETEVNNYGFEVQKSVVTDQKSDWLVIGFVKGSGNSATPRSYSFIDDNINFGNYLYRLKQINTDGQFEYSDIAEVTVNFPERFELYQNYPNPFNPATTIKFSIYLDGKYTLKVFDLIGQESVSLLNEEYLSAGEHSIKFDAENLPSGVYIYKLISNDGTLSGKMIHMK